MTDDCITFYGVTWCGDCRRAIRILKEYAIPFTYINIDQDKTAEQFVVKTNRGMRSVPTIVFPDGTILVEPTNAQLIQQLKLNQPILE